MQPSPRRSADPDAWSGAARPDQSLVAQVRPPARLTAPSVIVLDSRPTL